MELHGVIKFTANGKYHIVKTVWRGHRVLVGKRCNTVIKSSHNDTEMWYETEDEAEEALSHLYHACKKCLATL